MLNKVLLQGRLVKDPESRTTTGGSVVASFRLASQRNYVDSQGNRGSDFIDCVAWRQTAEFVCKYFVKGSEIIVEGPLQSRTYDAQDGSKRYVTEVLVEHVYFCGTKDAQGGGERSYSRQPAAYGSRPSPAQAQPASLDDGFDGTDDELPF
ncbi:MAG: single-stranded DNA-binding protein [Clostridia bacterium]